MTESTDQRRQMKRTPRGPIIRSSPMADAELLIVCMGAGAVSFAARRAAYDRQHAPDGFATDSHWDMVLSEMRSKLGPLGVALERKITRRAA